MKLSQSDRIRYGEEMKSEIASISEVCGDRIAGSSGENEALSRFERKLSQTADIVTREHFGVRPQSFLGWTYIVPTFLIAANVLFFFSPLMALICIVLAGIPVLLHFVCYLPTLDKLFPKKISSNVFATSLPSDPIRTRIVLCAHADSSYERHWMHEGGWRLFVITIALPIIGALYLFAVSVASVAFFGPVGTPSGWSIYCGLAGVIFIPSYVCFYLFCDIKRVSPGAGDDLSGCAVCLKAFSLMSRSKTKHTQVCALITGGQDAGLRGSRHFVKTRAQWKNDGIRTYFCVLDDLRDLANLTVYHRDRNATVALSSDMRDRLIRACADCDLPVRTRSLLCGATDASSFALGKFEAACLSASDPLKNNRHFTRDDTAESIDASTLCGCLEVVLTLIDTIDREAETLPNETPSDFIDTPVDEIDA